VNVEMGDFLHSFFAVSHEKVNAGRLDPALSQCPRKPLRELEEVIPCFW
jgi:hypothetical protein